MVSRSSVLGVDAGPTSAQRAASLPEHRLLCARREPGARRAQRGAAIVTAILIVTIVTVIVSGLFWREHVTVRSVENRMSLAQAQWIERVALDWTRVILRVDGAQRQVDHLGEFWAEPVPPTVVDETFTGGARVGDGSRSVVFAGQAFDAQGRLNLNNLLPTNEVQMRKASLDAFKKLLDLMGLPRELADRLQMRMATTVDRPGADGKIIPASNLPLVKLDDLKAYREFEPGIVEMLREHVVFLPRPTPVNLNTASALVVAAVIPSLQREDAVRFANRSRGNERKYETVGAALQAIKDAAAPAVQGMVSINSSYFLIAGVVRYDRVDSQTQTLIERTGGKVTVVWQQRS